MKRNHHVRTAIAVIFSYTNGIRKSALKSLAVPFVACCVILSGLSIASAAHDGGIRHSILERRDSWAGFVSLWKLRSKIFRLIDMEVVEEGGKLWYVGLFVKGGGRYALYRFNNYAAFVDKFKTLHRDGMKLVDFDKRTSGGKKRYTGVWRESKQGQYLFCYDNWRSFTTKWSELRKKRYHLVDVETESILEGIRGPGPKRLLKLTETYCGVWRPGSGRDGLFRLHWSEFKKKRSELKAKGLRLVDLGMSGNDNVRYTGAWLPRSGGSAFYSFDRFTKINAKWNELDAKGYRMIDVEAVRLKNHTQWAGIWDK